MRSNQIMTPRSRLAAIGLPVAIVVVGLCAALLAYVSLSSFVGYSPPVTSLPPARSAAGQSAGVVLVVVDGLRYDSSLQMPYLNQLRGQGAEFISEVTPPSLSLPAWTTLVTGATPDASGVTTNWHQGPVRVESLFDALRRSGRKSGVVGSATWSDLFPGLIDVRRYVYGPGESPTADRTIPAAYGRDVASDLGADASVVRASAALLKGESGPVPEFLVIHLLGVDELGHAYGGQSEQYDQGIANVDSLLEEITGAMDLSRQTLVVTGDHGQLARGGHGGAEPEVVRTPLVLVGKGIARPRTAGRAPAVVPQADVAPTLAVLLGVGIPAEGVGRPLFSALALDAATRAEWGVDALLARRERALAYSDALGVTPPDPSIGLSARNALAGRLYAQAASDADDGIDELDLWAASALDQRLGTDQLARLPVGLLGLAIPIAAAFLLRPRKETLQGLPFGLVYVAAFWVVFVWRGYGISLSALDRADSVQGFVADVGLSAAVLALLLGGIVTLAYHFSGRQVTLNVVTRYLFWSATFLVWQVAVYYVLYGATYRLYLPDTTLALVYFVDLLQLVGLAIATPLALGLAALVVRLAPTTGLAARAR